MKELAKQREEAVKSDKDYVPRFIQREGKRHSLKKRQRPWEEGGAEKKAKEEGSESTYERVKRRKSLIVLGYSGVNYQGMQRNPGCKTIEEELLTAMKKHEWITEDAFNQPQWIGFQRAARTDKGVSACMQCVSLKLRKFPLYLTFN